VVEKNLRTLLVHVRMAPTVRTMIQYMLSTKSGIDVDILLNSLTG
jgi:hypothetical protein